MLLQPCEKWFLARDMDIDIMTLVEYGPIMRETAWGPTLSDTLVSVVHSALLAQYNEVLHLPSFSRFKGVYNTLVNIITMSFKEVPRRLRRRSNEIWSLILQQQTKAGNSRHK
jgi:hypothetical protein